MELHVFETKQDMGRAAADAAAACVHAALQTRGAANVILATGASQFATLEHLVSLPIDWARVTVFHLDEYLGLSASHPASFRNYLQARFVARVANLRAFHAVNGDAADPQAECARLGALLRSHPIDVACVGIGENGHLAFNDPPADFETTREFLIVDLDPACRQQQFGEGWFPTYDAVPARALTMGIRQIMQSAAIICSVPDTRKAQAVKHAVEGPVTPQVPASILQRHPHCKLYLDSPAAALLSKA